VRLYQNTAVRPIHAAVRPIHTAVRLYGNQNDFDIIFAGDSSYDQAQVINGELPGANTDYVKTAETYKNLLAYASLRKTVYLPTHDANSGQRLVSKSFLV
jgi:N-acyl homoserine lactone hydrolase